MSSLIFRQYNGLGTIFQVLLTGDIIDLRGAKIIFLGQDQEVFSRIWNGFSNSAFSAGDTTMNLIASRRQRVRFLMLPYFFTACSIRLPCSMS